MRPTLHGLFTSALVALPGMAPSASAGPPVVVLARPALDSMSVVFARFNEHWNELGDLNTLEKMLGTVRPTQREYLGCLQGTVAGDTVRIEGWVPAAGMKQLQLAVAGTCDSVPRLIGTWHTHPYRADLQNLPIKEPLLSAQDLETLANSPLAVTLVMWDADSVDVAVRAGRTIVHPATVLLSPR
jgi:proteasome lid subunit RPN8/RPN11